MVYTPLEVIALIFIAISAIKLVVVLTSRMSWFNGIVKPIYSAGSITQLVSIILAGIIFYYISQEMTITQIFGAVALFAMLMVFSFATYPREMLEFAKKVYARKISVSQWFLILFWLVLIVLALAEVFS